MLHCRFKIRNCPARSDIETLDDVRLQKDRLTAFRTEVEAERRQIKEFLYENLYYSPSLAGEKDDAERIVKELFAFWMENPSALPPYYREKAGQESLPRVVCDYIAGMTDHFIIEQYEKHCGSSGKGSSPQRTQGITE